MSIPMPPPVKTVDKFGINVTGSTGQGPILQPKLKYRWRVLFLGFGGAGVTGGIAQPLTLNSNSVGMPTLTHEEVTVHSYNSRAYYMGKHEWSDIELTVRDTVDNTVTKAVGSQLQIQLDHYNQTGYRAGQDYKFTTQIQMLNGGFDSATVAWTLEGCFLKSVAYGELDYSVSDAVTITMTLRYDNAILEDQTGTNSIFPAVGPDPLGTFIDS
jgi:hypothetical protein